MLSGLTCGFANTVPSSPPAHRSESTHNGNLLSRKPCSFRGVGRETAVPSVGDLTRLAASFARHLQAGNKARRPSRRTARGYNNSSPISPTWASPRPVRSLTSTSTTSAPNCWRPRSAATANNQVPCAPAVLQVARGRGVRPHQPDGEDAAAIDAGTARTGHRPRRHTDAAEDLRDQILRGSARRGHHPAPFRDRCPTWRVGRPHRR